MTAAHEAGVTAFGAVRAPPVLRCHRTVAQRRTMRGHGHRTPSCRRLPADRRSLRIAVVTETYPPEVNGVARTIARGRRACTARHHDMQLMRPRQGGTRRCRRSGGALSRGADARPADPAYPNLRLGCRAKRGAGAAVDDRRPDVVHIATEGPAGLVGAAGGAHLKLPVCSDFRTNFHAYSRHYGVGWLRKPDHGLPAQVPQPHRRTMVPTERCGASGPRCGFRRLRGGGARASTPLVRPGARSAALRERGAWRPDDGGAGLRRPPGAEKNLACC
jgi:hypothetical protein